MTANPAAHEGFLTTEEVRYLAQPLRDTPVLEAAARALGAPAA